MIKEIVLLGDERLYKVCEEVYEHELTEMKTVVCDLHDTLLDFRRKTGAGRAIAAPQIGVSKRLVYMFIDKPVVFINPILTFEGNEMFELMDDCLSFPNLLVKVKRYKKLTINFKDINFEDSELAFEDDLAELLQHECDHLDGVLATMRAIDNKSFYHKGRRPRL